MNTPLAMLVVTLLAIEGPVPLPEPPGAGFDVPERARAEGAPVVYSHTAGAGPDQSFLLVGEGFTDKLAAWGSHPESETGRAIAPQVQLVDNRSLIATLPERAYDGPIVVWAENEKGFSEPVVLNAPEPWWCLPVAAEGGEAVRVFGRNLAWRPGFARASVYLAHPGAPGSWLKVLRAGKYELTVEMPRDIEPGEYQLWVHAGSGGQYGWGGPLPLGLRSGPASVPAASVAFPGGDLQEAVDRMAATGGGTLRLPEGDVPLAGTLVVPAGVRVEGAGMNKTRLLSPTDPAAELASVVGPMWNQGPSGIHTVGDRMVYRVAFPAAGKWTVWLRYATDMARWDLPGVSGHMTLAADGGEPVPLEDLPNTGSFAAFRWSRSAELDVQAGPREIVWQNVKGGGIHIDAVVFTRDPDYEPGDDPLPTGGERIVVVQGEEMVRFDAKDGTLPGIDRAAVWLAGDGASLADLTIHGTRRTNLGVAVRSPAYPQWIADCRVERVKVVGHEGKQAENCGIRLYNAVRAVVDRNELWGRAPIFLSGVRESRFTANRLVSVTLWGGNAEGYILGRNDTVRKCIIEDNVCASPPGAAGGGPTGRRMVWLSTGRGSVALNWIAGNREDASRFGGVAGTDQNVGEMILFEACQRIAYYGPPVAAGPRNISLPARLSPTPEEHLGSVARERLAYDAEGNETPFWPPEVDQGTTEPTVGEYFVTVLRGRGMGQTRRVLARQGETYELDRPWRVAPDADGLILVHTAFWRNHIIGNRTVDGMTGIQLWISCIENIVSDNVVARMRKPAVYLYGNCSTLASSMPTTWNRGIGPLYFNHVEGTRAEETSCGALVTSGEMHNLPLMFPRCLGNVLRHNSFVRSRTDGVLLTGNRPAGEEQPSDAVVGTIAEFNVVRDALVGYRVARSVGAVLLRRNHAYFWYPVSLDPGPRIAFRVDNEEAAVTIEKNSVEGIHGSADGRIVEEQRGPQAP
ncbi:MAG: hypothetical protein RBS80_01830 [Thermoguttaceae bacterium]|jgi:hypothetical protein|nr:hypothetical protein [Thermoguttaceae bacterium]